MAFFAAAELIEDDGLMAIMGWVLTAVAAVWTVVLLMLAAISAAISTLRPVMFD